MDPMLSLALSVQSNPGVYAILLGSGVSRAAQIPTGWEITLDLVQKVAAMMGADTGADPAAWYTAEFGSAPEYSDILERLAREPAERQRLLRSYFEPTADEREEGIKVPTGAHHAIARLAAKGYIRVIVTTNFDTLMEQALEAESVIPTVVSTPYAAVGAPPLIHSGVTIIKLHGDYRDTRIKNTPEELSEYDSAMQGVLDRVLDEFGLVVSGWSAKWDPALRAAIQRCPTRRYATYWTDVGTPGEEAQDLINHRRGEFIRVAGADAFFHELEEKVMALETLNRPHPLSVATAVVSVKRYLPEERYGIRLHDLVLDEAARTLDRLDDPVLTNQAPRLEPEDLLLRVKRCEAHSEILRGMFATGCFWGGAKHHPVWIRSLERLGSPVERPAGTIWDKLLRYPATLVMYTGALGAVANDHFDTLRAVLVDAMLRGSRQRDEPAVLHLQKWAALERDHARALPGMERHHTPLSDRIHEVLRPAFETLVPQQSRYDDLFDRMEYLIALVHWDTDENRWGPVGRFHWRARHTDSGPRAWLRAEIEARGEQISILQGRLFGGSLERLRKAASELDEFLKHVPFY